MKKSVSPDTIGYPIMMARARPRRLRWLPEAPRRFPSGRYLSDDDDHGCGYLPYLGNLLPIRTSRSCIEVGTYVFPNRGVV